MVFIFARDDVGPAPWSEGCGLEAEEELEPGGKFLSDGMSPIETDLPLLAPLVDMAAVWRGSGVGVW